MADTAEFPFDIESFVATMTRILMERGHRTAVAVLAYGTTTPRRDGYYDFGRYHYSWHLVTRLKPEAYGRLDEEERKKAETVLLKTAQELYGNEHEEGLIGFSISASIEKHPAWKQVARDFAHGRGGIQNQGRVRSDNPAMKMQDGLFFRSEPEVNFYLACKAANLVCAPLPVFLRPGRTPPYRIEPDMLILRKNMVIQVEIDGDAFHLETPAEAQERTRSMEREGVRVYRIKAANCGSVEKARVALQAMLQHFDLELPKTG